VETFLASVRHLKTPILIGILPLYSHRNAEFLHNEVPGMRHPRRHPGENEEGGVGGFGAPRGRGHRREALAAARDLAQGAYVMPPFNKVELAIKVIESLG
jgi:homocysteine S-methyltransferase